MGEPAKDLDTEELSEGESKGSGASNCEDQGEFTSKDLKFTIVEEVTKTNALEGIAKVPSKDHTQTQTLANADVEGLKPYPQNLDSTQWEKLLEQAMDRLAEKLAESMGGSAGEKLTNLVEQIAKLKEDIAVVKKQLGLCNAADLPISDHQVTASEPVSEPTNKPCVNEGTEQLDRQCKRMIMDLLQKYPSLKSDLAQLNRQLKNSSWSDFVKAAPAQIKAMHKKAPEAKKEMLDFLRLVKK